MRDESAAAMSYNMSGRQTCVESIQDSVGHKIAKPSTRLERDRLQSFTAEAKCRRSQESVIAAMSVDYGKGEISLLAVLDLSTTCAECVATTG